MERAHRPAGALPAPVRQSDKALGGLLVGPVRRSRGLRFSRLFSLAFQDREMIHSVAVKKLSHAHVETTGSTWAYKRTLFCSVAFIEIRAEQAEFHLFILDQN